MRKINRLLKELGFNSRYMVAEVQYGRVGGLPVNKDEAGNWDSAFIQWDGGRNFLKDLRLYNAPHKDLERPVKFENGDELDFYLSWKDDEIAYRRGDGDILVSEPTIGIVKGEPKVVWGGGE